MSSNKQLESMETTPSGELQPRDNSATRSKLKELMAGDFHTDTYQRLATDDVDPTLKIIVIPGIFFMIRWMTKISGNPGVVSFYIPFVNHIYDQLDGKYSVIAGNILKYHSISNN